MSRFGNVGEDREVEGQVEVFERKPLGQETGLPEFAGHAGLGADFEDLGVGSQPKSRSGIASRAKKRVSRPQPSRSRGSGPRRAGPGRPCSALRTLA